MKDRPRKRNAKEIKAAVEAEKAEAEAEMEGRIASLTTQERELLERFRVNPKVPVELPLENQAVAGLLSKRILVMHTSEKRDGLLKKGTITSFQ